MGNRYIYPEMGDEEFARRLSLAVNGVTYAEREKEWELWDKLQKRNQGHVSPYLRWSQKNLEHTSKLTWLSLNHPVSMAIFVLFEDRMDKKNGVICSQKALAEMLNVSIRTIIRAISVLEEREFVRVYKTGKENIYAVNDDIVWKTSHNKRWMSRFQADVIISLSEQTEETQKRVIEQIKSEKYIDLETGEIINGVFEKI